MEQKQEQEGISLPPPPPQEALPEILTSEQKEKNRIALHKNYLAYEVKKVEGGDHGDYVAYILARPHCYYCGDTPEEAIGRLLKGVAELARDGRMDPDDPMRHGTPTLQHVLGILERQLAFEIKSCQGYIDMFFANDGPPGYPTQSIDAKLSAEKQRQKDFVAARRSVVSGLATAIAALGRVNEL